MLGVFRFSPDKVRAQREREGLSREQFAVEVARSFPAIVLYESGGRTPPTRVIERMCAVLHCSPDDLFDEITDEVEVAAAAGDAR